MDECENLIIDLEVYETFALQQQQINESSDVEFSELRTLNEDENMGQSESKKHAKKYDADGVETKGTAMSFGFRKKLNTTPKKLRKLIEGDSKKKQDKCNNSHVENNGRHETQTPMTGSEYEDEEMHNSMMVVGDQDNNGNSEEMGKVIFEKVGAAAKTTPKSILSKGAPCELPYLGGGNRFGYRGANVARPASTGLASKYQRAARENVENNNCSMLSGENTQETTGLVSNLKRRSKSAHAGRALTSRQNDQSDCASSAAAAAAATPKITQPKSITFNLNQNSTIEYQRQQFFQQPPAAAYGRASTKHQPQFVNSGLHTNVIVRPTPRAPAATYAKFTLQTVSLPRPEFPVAISLSANTPTTPGSSVCSPTPAGFGARAKADAQPHPLTRAAQTTHMDSKSVKQMANNTRRGFSGSREISADSGIASMDMAIDNAANGRSTSPKRSRSRPRNLQMVMSGRHKFEVRELDLDPLSSESSSFVESLALPKLPTENQTVPLPLSGLVRSNTVLSRESFERKNTSNAVQQVHIAKPNPKTTNAQNMMTRNSSEECDSIDEEKLYLDRSTSEKSAKHYKDINTCSSKTSSPGSSIMSSWCNAAGESMAAKDCSSMSFSSSEESNKRRGHVFNEVKLLDESPLDFNDDELSAMTTDMQISTISSITEAAHAAESTPSAAATNMKYVAFGDANVAKQERPRSIYHNTLNETKFAEMALAGSEYLLDDETSPTDSLASSTEESADEAGAKLKKHKHNAELQEKNIDEISPELEEGDELGSPISPGTPTHASHSLSLSDCGNLIDDEIADQPALMCHNETHDGVDSSVRKDTTDTPTLMDTVSLHSLKSQSKARSALQQAIELSLRTPVALRKAVMARAESLDTLSPCDSICSDDLMMDFDLNSSVDSIEHSASVRSRSGSDLNKLDEAELFANIEHKGSGDIMKGLNSILRARSNSNRIRNADKESIIAHLPARATRLLNRSRLQQQQQQCLLNNAADSDSSKSPAHSIRRSNAASRASSVASTSNASLQRNKHLQQRDTHSSSDDLMLYDKSFRNAMIQDVLQFKKQLLRLRRILQETETLNPFENDNGQLFASCGLDSKLLDDIDLASLTSSTTDDPIQELADLRRQGQVEERDRTIRLQRNLIEKLEAEKLTPFAAANKIELAKECINTATQTERTRPFPMGAEGLSRSKPEFTSYTTHFPAICNDATTTSIIHHQQQQQSGTNNNQTRRHTIISTTLTNYNHQLAAHSPRRASIAWEKQPREDAAAPIASATTTSALPVTAPTYKPVRITQIGDPLKPLQQNGSDSKHKPQQFLNVCKDLLNGDCKENGYCDAAIYQQAKDENTKQQQQQQHHQQQQQQFYQSPLANGKLNPTVTIV